MEVQLLFLHCTKLISKTKPQKTEKGGIAKLCLRAEKMFFVIYLLFLQKEIFYYFLNFDISTFSSSGILHGKNLFSLVLRTKAHL